MTPVPCSDRPASPQTTGISTARTAHHAALCRFKLSKLHTHVAVVVALIGLQLSMDAARGDIDYGFLSPYSGQVIPGTQGMTPGPGVDLSGWNAAGHSLEFASLMNIDLTNASFANSRLDSAAFQSSTLSNASFANSNLTNAALLGATLTNANFTGAIINGALLDQLSQVQLYSTASYMSGDLSGVSISSDLIGVSFANKNLTNAALSGALTGADFSGATIKGGSFSQIGPSQFYSTASYASGDLSGIGLGYKDLTGWNLANKNLMKAYLGGSTLTNASVSGANLTGATLFYSTLINSDFTNADLANALMYGTTATGANFSNANLSGAAFFFAGYGLTDRVTSNLSNASFAGANLSSALLTSANLSGVSLAGAIVKGASLSSTNLTANQLYSTASYASGDLTGIGLQANNLAGWNLANKSLANADLLQATLTGTNFGGADLTNANLVDSQLTNANFSNAVLSGANISNATMANVNFRGAIVIGANFSNTSGFTAGQLYSTVSYASGDLAGIGLGGIDLTGWNFANQNLTGAGFGGATLTNATFTGAVIKGAAFTTASGFSASQLYSTASYVGGDLSGIVLANSDMSGWSFGNKKLISAILQYSTLAGANFAGSDLTGASLLNSKLSAANFGNTNLTNANLNSSTLGGANFAGAVVKGANLTGTTSGGFTASQFYSTASYVSGDLSGIGLGNNDLTGWSFANKNLANATFPFATLANANFAHAQINGSDFSNTTHFGFSGNQLYSTASYAAGNLTGVGLGNNDLTSWNLASQNLSGASFYSADLTNANLSNANLTNASFYYSTLTNANLSGATVKGADFSSYVLYQGLSASQLYSTASYTGGDLTGIVLFFNDLTGWNLANKNLTGADFAAATLNNTLFTSAVLVNADFGNVTLTSTNFTDADLRGATGWTPDGTTIKNNTIRPDGSILGLALSAGERLVVRNNAIAVTVVASATFDAAATIQFVLDRNWTSPVEFDAGVIPSLSGRLDLVPADNFVPVSGDSFVLMTYSGKTGAFASVTGTNPTPGLTYNVVYLPGRLVVLTTGSGEKTWGVDSDGNLSSTANWIGGAVPGGVGNAVTFSTIIAANRTVTIDADTTIGTLKFDSPNNYTLSGPRTLTLQAAQGSAAAINVVNTHGNGAPTISAPITLASDLSIAQNSSGTLRLTGPVNDSAAHAITLSGTGFTEIDGAPNLGAGTALIVNAGTLRFNLTSGAATIGTGVQVTVNGSATLELAGSVAAISSGAKRARIVNNSVGIPGSAGVLVSGTNEIVGAIDGFGSTRINAGSNLTASHIIQGALLIGGSGGSPALLTIDASDATGNPLSQLAADWTLAGANESGLGVGAISPFDGSLSTFAIPPLPGSAGPSGDLVAAGRLLNNVAASGQASVPEPSALWLAFVGLAAAMIRVQWIARRIP